MGAIEERGHTPVVCTDPECYGCNFCAGGLDMCSVCNGAEGSLPTNCPGVRMAPEWSEAVYAQQIDFRDGLWVNLPPSSGGAS